MKCLTHQAEAIGICAYCGRALCPDCTKNPAGQRMVCSEQCAGALLRADQAIELLIEKNLQTGRASALYSFLCAGLSAGGAVGAWFYLHVPFLIWFCAGCSVVFTASGIWYSRISRKPNP